VVGLGLKIEEVREGTQGPEVVPDVVDDAFFHFALFMRASGVARSGDNGEGAEEVQEGFIETDKGSHALGDCGQHVICDKFFWGALEETKRIEKAAVEGLLSLGVGELQVKKAAVAFQDGQAVELARCIPIDNRSEVAPIDLALLPWGRLKADEGFFVFEVASKGVQIVFEDGHPSIKAQWSDPLKDHRGGGLCVDLQEPLDFFFERVQLAGSCYGGSLGVRVYEELCHGFWIEMEGIGDSLF